MDITLLKKYKCDNINELIKFSHCEKMENVLYRDEEE